MQEAAGEIRGRDRLHALDPRVVGAGQIRRAADELRHGGNERLERDLGSLAGRHLLRRGGKLLLDGLHGRGERALGKLAAHPALEFLAKLRGERPHPFGPGFPRGSRPRSGFSPLLAHVRGNFERRIGPAEPLPRRRDLLGAQRRAVALFRAGLGRRAEPDQRAATDECRPVGTPGGFDRRRNGVGIMTVDTARIPAGGFEAPHLIDGIRKLQRSVDRDRIVVVEHDQLAELQVPGERDRLLTDALHEIAVGSEHVGAMVDDLGPEHGRKMPFGDRHADRIGEPLAERSGRRLDARRVAVFRMPGRDRSKLSEPLDLFDGHRLDAEKVQHRVDQHRAVAGREHETVAIGPGRIGRVELQKSGEQDGRHVGGAHRQSGMAGLGGFDGIHGEGANGVRHAVVLRARNHQASLSGRQRGSPAALLSPRPTPG